MRTDEELEKEIPEDRYGVKTVGGLQEYSSKVQDKIKKDKGGKE